MTKSPDKRATKAAVVAGLVTAVALLAAGCGSSSDASGTTAPVTDTTAVKAIKVGLITDLGQLNDNGFNEGAYNGLKRAERVLGVKGRVVESASAADYVPNMSTLAKQGYDLIIGVGFAQGDAIATVAKKYPEHQVRNRRRRSGDAQGQADERRSASCSARSRSGISRLPGRARGEARRREQDQRRRRVQGAAGRPLHRGLPGGREGSGARHRRQVGLLAGLGRPGEVQGARAQPDRGGLEGRVPGRRRLWPRRAARRQGAEGVGHRRRRRPVVPRPARADERAQGCRQRRLPDLQVRAGRDVQGRRPTPSSASTRTASASASSARSPTRRTSRRRRRSSSRSRTARSPTFRRRWASRSGHVSRSRMMCVIVRRDPVGTLARKRQHLDRENPWLSSPTRNARSCRTTRSSAP